MEGRRPYHATSPIPTLYVNSLFVYDRHDLQWVLAYQNRRNQQSGDRVSREFSTHFWTPQDQVPARPMIMVSGSSTSTSRRSDSLNIRLPIRWRPRPDPVPAPVSPSASIGSSSGSSDGGYSPASYEASRFYSWMRYFSNIPASKASARQMDRSPIPPLTLAMPQPSNNYPHYEHFFANSAPPTPTGYQHPAPMQVPPEVPNVVPPEVPSAVPRGKPMTQAQFTILLTSEYVAKHLTEVGFDIKENRDYKPQLALVTQTFQELELKHPNGQLIYTLCTLINSRSIYVQSYGFRIERHLYLMVFEGSPNQSKISYT